MNKVRLGDVATYINGYAFKPADRSSVGLPIIRIQDLTGNAYDLGFYDGEYPERIEINNGDVLISWSASLGVYVWNKGKALLNQHIFKVVFDKIEIDKQFFVYAVEHSLQKMVKQTHGATMKHIIKKDFDNTLIPYPSLEQQKSIAKLLDKTCDLIGKMKLQASSLDELIKSRFVEMFGDPETNPYSWNRVTLQDVCSSIVRGPFGSALKKEFFVSKGQNTYKVYEQKHAIQKSATIGEYYITHEKFDELKRFECKADDFIMSCSGTMGELYQLPEGCERGVINQALCKFTLNERILPTVFLNYMKSTIGNLETKGSGIKNIAAVSYVKALPINLPPLKVQQEFSDFVTQVENQKATVQQSINKLETLKKSLMQEYFG